MPVTRLTGRLLPQTRRLLPLRKRSPRRSLRELFVTSAGAVPYPQGMGNPFERWHKELLESDRDPKTRDRYWQIACSYRAWLGDRSPDAPSAKEYIAHLRDRGYAQRSVLLYYHALRLFLEFLGQPLRLKMRKPKSLPPYYDQGDIEALIAQAERGLRAHTPEQRRRNTAIVVTLAFTGLRRGELLALRVADVDFERRVIRVREGKGQKDRAVPMHDRIVIPLRGQCEGKGAQGLVFPLSPRSLYGVVHNLARKAGLEGFHPHSLRHAFATRLMERGANIRNVQKLLGHESIETTAQYLDVTARHLEETVALLDGPAPTLLPRPA